MYKQTPTTKSRKKQYSSRDERSIERINVNVRPAEAECSRSTHGVIITPKNALQRTTNSICSRCRRHSFVSTFICSSWQHSSVDFCYIFMSSHRCQGQASISTAASENSILPFGDCFVQIRVFLSIVAGVGKTQEIVITGANLLLLPTYSDDNRQKQTSASGTTASTANAQTHSARVAKNEIDCHWLQLPCSL